MPHQIFIPFPIRLMNLDTGVPLYKELDEFQKGEATKTVHESRKNEDGEIVGVTRYYQPDEPWTIFRWLTRYIFSNPKLGKGDLGSKRMKRLKKAFKDAKPMTYVPVDSELRDAILKIAEDPGQDQWIPAITGQMADFVETFSQATEGSVAELPVPPAWYVAPENAVIEIVTPPTPPTPEPEPPPAAAAALAVPANGEMDKVDAAS
jgi:hypothetical protein